MSLFCRKYYLMYYICSLQREFFAKDKMCHHGGLERAAQTDQFALMLDKIHGSEQRHLHSSLTLSTNIVMLYYTLSCMYNWGYNLVCLQAARGQMMTICHLLQSECVSALIIVDSPHICCTLHYLLVNRHLQWPWLLIEMTQPDNECRDAGTAD